MKRIPSAVTFMAVLMLAGVARAGSAPSDNDDFEDRAGYSHVWSHVPAKQMAMLSSCQRVANKLSVDVAGSTAFCPVNWAWTDFAHQLGYYSADPVGELLAGVPEELLKTLFLSHVVPGAVLPTSSFKPGHSTLKTAAASSTDEDISITVRRLASGFLDVLYDSNLDLNGDFDDMVEDDGLSMANLTFEGPYVDGSSNYVIHPVDQVMIPGSAVGKLLAIQAANRKVNRKLLAVA